MGHEPEKVQNHSFMDLWELRGRVVYNCFQIGVENSNDFFGFPKEESG
jgi:hypothetical protein